jgi:hypothetical protein
MAGGAPGLGHLPGQQRTGVIDAQRLVVPAVDPQVDDPDVGLAAIGYGWCGGEGLRPG